MITVRPGSFNRRFCHLALILGLLLAGVAVKGNAADSPLFGPTDLGIQRFGHADGLTATTTYGLGVSDNGNLWVYSNIGVYRYNGFQFQSLPQLAGKEVIHAVMVNDSMKVVMSFDNSITLVNTRNLSQTRELVLPDSMQLRSFALSALEYENKLFIGTSDGRLLIFNPSTEDWDQILLPTDRGSPRRIGFMYPTGERLLLGGTNGTWVFDPPDNVRPLQLEDAVFSKPAAENDGWGITRNGFARMTDTGLEVVYSNETLGLTSLVTQHLWVTDQELWLATQADGLKIVTADSQGEIRVETFFEDMFFTGIARDPSGAVWVSTLNDGIFKFQPWFRSFRDVKTADNVPLQQVVFADISADGRYSIISSRFNKTRLYDHRNDSWQTLTDANVEYARWMNESTLFLARSNGFDLYDVGSRQWLQQYTGAEFNIFIQPPVKQADYRDNLIAIATPNGSFVINRQTNRIVFSLPNRATAVGFAAADRLIVGQPNRLLVASMDAQQDLISWDINVNDLIAIDSTSFLIATANNGLLRLNTDSMVLDTLHAVNPLRNQSWTLVRKLSDSLYGVAGSMGAYLLRLDHDKTAFYDIPLRPVSLGQTLRDIRLVGDYVWMSTGDGVVQFPLETLFNLNLQPVVQVSQLFADEIEMGRHALTRLDADISQLRVELSNTGYPNADRYMLQFRQNSADEWVELTQPTVVLAQLAAGNSSFEFRFLDLLTGNSVSPVTLDIFKSPLWWQTPAFLAFLGTILLLLGITVTYTVQQRIQQRKVASFERADKIRKLERVAVTQLLTSHYVFNALTTIRALMRKSSDEALDYIGRFAKVIRVLVDQSFEIDVDLQSELDWIDDYLTLESTNRGIELDYSFENTTGLDLEDIAIPSFTLQPVYENALLYGTDDEGRIKLRCRVEKNEDTIEIILINSVYESQYKFDGSGTNHQPDGLLISGADMASKEDTLKKGSVGLRLMHDRLRNWVAFHGIKVDDSLLESGAEGSWWVTRIRVPFIPYE